MALETWPIKKQGNYDVLHSSPIVNHAIKENHIIPFSEFRSREKCNEQTRGKITNKVRFNLNVKLCEPNLTANQILDNNEEKESDNRNGKTEGLQP
ncbi:hypothetical protein Fmac_024966 [Flemingia macrophylla]|uniref:Uncharacterized protein n=1 Tax=Flemingia macrophylla TaxID=520843 RepID=A0ABD1LRH4_9FABA